MLLLQLQLYHHAGSCRISTGAWSLTLSHMHTITLTVVSLHMSAICPVIPSLTVGSWFNVVCRLVCRTACIMPPVLLAPATSHHLAWSPIDSVAPAIRTYLFCLLGHLTRNLGSVSSFQHDNFLSLACSGHPDGPRGLAGAQCGSGAGRCPGQAGAARWHRHLALRLHAPTLCRLYCQGRLRGEAAAEQSVLLIPCRETAATFRESKSFW